MRKKILIPLFILFASFAQAQLNNSWIDYSKTYYTFRISKDTLCRIPQSAIASAGLSTVNANYFQLWRNGEEIRLYTSVSNAPLGTNDFIEFWGQMNDGKSDNQLYRDPNFQLSDRYSLETDTAAYFLTVNSLSPNLRYASVNNTAPSVTTPDAYFMRNVDYYYHDDINRGEARVIGEYVYSSAYDPAEGWSSNPVYPDVDLLKEFVDLNVYTAGPSNSLSVRANLAGSAPNTRDVKIKLFQNEITTSPYSSTITLSNFEYKKINIQSLPISLLQNPSSVQVYVNGNSAISTDRIVVASVGLTYPATFNFANTKYFPFELTAAPSGNYLVIDNFNYGSTAPVLYDISSGNRYVGEILSTPGKVKFVLPASNTGRKFILMSQETPQLIGVISQRNFLDLTNANNQADYMIISNPALYNDGNGNNYVDQYRQYRSSSVGGGYNAKVFDIQELTDQFGFGIKNHPGSIRDFIRYANSSFITKPNYVFIIGRGLNYIDQKLNESNPICNQLNLVTTFGWPASDGLLSALPGFSAHALPIGRLGAINPTEVNNYLLKIKQYESSQLSSSGAIIDKSWMKNILHIAGGKDSSENLSFVSYMNGYKAIAEDTLFGGRVETFSKTSTGAIQQVNSQRIEELFNQGLGFIGYFGHSSANTFEFNLSNPESYNNPGKYPFFNVSGCSAGNFYIFDPQRLSGTSSLSEKYILANQRGSIGFLADTHFGIPPFLNFYNSSLYNAFSKTMYGNTIGNQIKHVTEELGGNDSNLDFYTRIHLEEINLHGDPALKINSFTKPDYVIEDQLVRISPNIITVADNSFNVKINMKNIGKAVGDSMWISVKRIMPDNSIKVLYDQHVPSIRNEDSLNLTVPILSTSDKGLNKIIVNLDYNNNIEEQFENNNTLTKEFYIFEDELRAVFPYNFSIVNQQNITFMASTANPLSGLRQYVMEVDTTELFNSSFKKSYNQNGLGGVVSFTPSNIVFSDSTVYYWRVAMVPINNAVYIWSNSSFIYLSSSTEGVNQSHYYQFKNNVYDNMVLEADRKFAFKTRSVLIQVNTASYPYAQQLNQFALFINTVRDQCGLSGPFSTNYEAVRFYIIDSFTLKPWVNQLVGSAGMYGSYAPQVINSISRAGFFQFAINTPSDRQVVKDFIDIIPNGNIIIMVNGGAAPNTQLPAIWATDPGINFYQTLKSLGFSSIDLITTDVPYVFVGRKGNAVPISQLVAASVNESLSEEFSAIGPDFSGQMTSAVFGPAKEWKEFHYRGRSAENIDTDSTNFEIIGITQGGTESRLFYLDSTKHDFDISSINAIQYPYLKLKMSCKDSINASPYQLGYWRVNYSPVPEGAMAPNILFQMKDTVEQGEMIDFKVAFKNISATAFDSAMKFNFVITDKDNVPHVISLPKGKILISGDTLTVQYTIDSKTYTGNNTLFVDVNPNNDQLEQAHFNNVLFKNFYVRPDKYNPLLDVTFDGVHILNKDIVASKPQILIKLQDESRYMELKDTSLLSLKVRFPDQSIHTYYFGDTMVFHPANLSTGENTASINFMPYFPEDGDYELIVTGKDVVGNQAGNLDYHVIFTVLNKPMISNLLNYPNPFTTSTAFVFTVTGMEVPQNIRIQILTITGKVVREITKAELGPIHIGRNITEYKWDGTDMYGQKLANGVYLYRVLTNLNGKSLDKYRSSDDNTDKYFNKGYGKMYLMR